MPSVQNDTPHPVRTARRGLTYQITPKHHGGNANASCWLTTITFAEEFSIFDRADGIVVQVPVRMTDNSRRRRQPLRLRDIGGCKSTSSGTGDFNILADLHSTDWCRSWHGYPIWPISPIAPPQFQGGVIPKSVHAALRLDCFLVDVCVTSSSSSSSAFNSARHSGGVQRQSVRRSLAIASRVCSTISSHRPDTTAARS